MNTESDHSVNDQISLPIEPKKSEVITFYLMDGNDQIASTNWNNEPYSGVDYLSHRFTLKHLLIDLDIAHGQHVHKKTGDYKGAGLQGKVWRAGQGAYAVLEMNNDFLRINLQFDPSLPPWDAVCS